MECKYKEPTFATTKAYDLDTDCLFRQANGKHVGYCKRPELYRCVEDVWKKPILLSHTGLQTFLTCHHLYYLKYIRGIETKKGMLSKPLKLGILWDTCLQFLLGKTDVGMNDIVDEYEIENREIAKVKALYRAVKALDIKFDMDCQLQPSFFYNVDLYTDNKDADKLTVNGKYDRKYMDGFVETKLSGRPDFYLDLFFLESQVGTYFAVDPALQYCIMEISRTPDLKSTGQFKNETDDDYEERCYQDIISRPSFYFIGYDRDKHTYGKKFFRSEFDVDGVMDRYRHVAREIKEASVCDGWYKNSKVCTQILPGIPCDMLSVCRHNTMSETVFQIKQIPPVKL